MSCHRVPRQLMLVGHRQHHSEARLGAHHPCVSLWGAGKRHCLDHRTHTRERAELEGVLRVDRRTGGVTNNAAAGTNQLQRRNLDRLGIDAHNDQSASYCQPLDHRCHRLALVTVANTARAPPRRLSLAATSSVALSMKWCAPRLRDSASLSEPRAIATVRKPSLFANCTPRWPRPPIPSTATTSPGIAPLWRSALKVVTPAQSSGAASTALSWSGISKCVGRGHHRVRITPIIGDAGNAQI